MDTQQKAETLNALAEISIKLDGNNYWYARNNTHLLDGIFLEALSGRGSTPEAAIDDLWERTVALPKPNQTIILNPHHPDFRRSVKWNGFMWDDVE